MKTSQFLSRFAWLSLMLPGPAWSDPAALRVVSLEDRISVQTEAGTLVAEYRLEAPKDAGLPVDSGGFFHPLTTPGGKVVTDLAPADHPHHRGVFLAWVEMHGAKDADFWGWGEHAPIAGRRIVHAGVELLEETGEQVRFRARNEWKAEEEVLVRETLTAAMRAGEEASVLDLTYEIAPTSDLTLSRWAFSGFCLRFRRDGDLTFFSPEGKEDRANPVHTEPESDWPDAAWYAAELRLDDGETLGAAVFNHTANPPVLWHNHRDVRMINPCIVAPAEVRIPEGKPLVLRYRIAAFDGPVRREFLDRLAAEWRGEGPE